jgi:hypothetical protein
VSPLWTRTVGRDMQIEPARAATPHSHKNGKAKEAFRCAPS